jgi:hypothetical protein
MNEQVKAMIKEQVTNLFKQFMAKEIDEKQLIEKLWVIHNASVIGKKSIWFKWHNGHPAAITVSDIKTGLTNAHMRNRVHMCECIEATINDNSLVVNFS